MYKKTLVLGMLLLGSSIMSGLPDPDLFDGSLIESGQGEGGSGSSSEENKSAGAGSAQSNSDKTAGGASSGNSNSGTEEKQSNSGSSSTGDNAKKKRDFGNTKIGSQEVKKIPEGTSKETVEEVIERRLGSFSEKKKNEDQSTEQRRTDNGNAQQKDKATQDNTQSGTIPEGM